ncbi:hypothetical protein ACFC09_10975 [Streptomyces sp. NPDC056161]|uniref:hypothetical protein n=1 Tax=Streptomyces sp. NPDC056161 TaxID=3345732 RepID=UPI0035D6AF8F
MTHPSESSAAPPGPAPGRGLPTMPAVPPRPAPPAPPVDPSAPAWRTVFASGVAELRAGARTEPGRLRVIGAVLALLVVAFGAVTTWQTADREAAAHDVLYRSQPLSADAADIYSSLADANTAASSAFLAGGQETSTARDRYESGIRKASGKLVTAAANSEPGSPATGVIDELSKLLTEYKGLVERARVYNRLGYPVGGAYLRLANSRMQDDMLPAAEKLYRTENTRLNDDYGDATAYPWPAIGLGVLALGALGWAQRRSYLRTNRVLNHGLVTATATAAVVLLWLVVGHSVARAGLNDSNDHGVRSLTVLHDARIASLKARGNENLSLVARGADTVKVGKQTVDKYYYAFDQDMAALDRGLAEAGKLADDATGTAPVTAARDSVTAWKQRHASARAEDENGNYQQALDQVIGTGNSTGEYFDTVDDNLRTALAHEQTEFERAAAGGLDALTGLPEGAAVLAVLGAAGAVLGIGRRLSEYR